MPCNAWLVREICRTTRCSPRGRLTTRLGGLRLRARWGIRKTNAMYSVANANLRRGRNGGPTSVVPGLEIVPVKASFRSLLLVVDQLSQQNPIIDQQSSTLIWVFSPSAFMVQLQVTRL